MHERGLSLQGSQLVDIDALLRLEDLHDQCKTHSYLSGGHGNDEEHEDLPAETLVHAGKSHKSQVCAVKHQLDGHENDQRVAADEHTERTDDEQHGGKCNVIIDRYHQRCAPISGLVKTIAPTIATSSRMEVTDRKSTRLNSSHS